MIFLLDEPWLLSIAVCIVLITSSVLGYRVAVSTRINEDSHHHNPSKENRGRLVSFVSTISRTS